ncbi:MAG: hypothetical protein II992_04170 [Lachnospiraceae bacterium]|nr:hypothetical protein [Lachnospiraceae bacterium]
MSKGRINFTVYGSCVTRDVFNFLDNELYYPNVTVEFNPIQTLFDTKFEIDKEYIDVDSSFTNRMIYYNFSKEAKNVLENSKSDYFIFDMTSERLPLQIWSYSGMETMIPVTWNTYCLGNKLRETEKYRSIEIRNWHLPNADKSWQEHIKMFCESIIQRYEPSKIILLSIEQADLLLAKESFSPKSLTMNRNEFTAGIDKRQLREKQNKIIQQAEKYVQEYIPDCWVIKMPQNVIGNARHHFKEHPLHFDYLYYEYVAEAIKLIAKERTEENRKLIQKELEFLLLRYNEKFTRIRQIIERAEGTHIQYFGSGILYEALKQSNEIFLDNPICDISMAAVLSEPYAVTRKNCEEFLVEGELTDFLDGANKIHRLRLEYSEAKWLVLDIRSEFQGVLKMKDNRVIMDTYFDKIHSLIKCPYDRMQGISSPQIINDFCELILRKWKLENIIVIENYYNELCVSEHSHIEKNEKAVEMNTRMKGCFELIYERMGKCKIIHKPDNVLGFTSRNIEWMSMDEKLYFRDALKAIVNGKEDEVTYLYQELAIKNSLLIRGMKKKGVDTKCRNTILG